MSVSDLIGALDAIPKLTVPESLVPEETSVFLDAPEWLTESYLQDALRKYYNDQHIRINWVKVNPALGKGENYGGVLTRVKAQFTRSDGSSQLGHYIVKSTFEGNEFAQNAMKPYDIFNREMIIYEQVLPKQKALLREIGDAEQIFAETMAVDIDNSALIFEDLNARGFVMPDRLVGLDQKLARIVLRKLAKMHATSAVLNERENHILESYDRGFFNRYTDNYEPAFVGMLQAATRRVAQWPGYEKYAEKLKALVPIYMELGKRIFDISPGHINVLAHGDLWTNNVLVKYDKQTGEPIDVVIIDFQYTAWGSPALDLFYFMNSSLEFDLHQNHQEQLIAYYFSHFADTLKKLQYRSTIPSLHQFHQQLQQKKFYAAHTSISVFPVQRNVETADADFNALMETNQRAMNFKDACYRNPIAQRILRELLPDFEAEGLLDADQ
ncbi:uncharacterized protein LOC117145611 [Drosophila mauritiana]|uniref:Uncharacterized protein LOC117145611 n=1 Tax=Drosophila mauritiana TaxID=7226 RepID=A0A6P8KHY4_DROMA|nr:uncharacterized protein LOC117145611 [Drosophila mauritiana]